MTSTLAPANRTPWTDAADSAEFAALPESERTRVEAWLSVLSPVLSGPRAGRGAAIADVARTMGTSVSTARRQFDLLAKDGWQALVDRRRAPSHSSHGPAGYDEAKFVSWLRSLAETYGGNLKAAHRAAVGIWRSGQHVPGYAFSPDSTATGLPAGWTYANIARLARLTPYERATAYVGRAAARSHAPMVVRTRRGLHVGEVYMADDVWHDVECHMLGRSAELVRPLELAILDVYSAHKCAWGMKPRVRDDKTGKRVNLRASDMRFLLAHLFCNVGYYVGGCSLIAEHGTAAVEGGVADILAKYSGGKIKIVEGGILDAPAIAGSFAGAQKGNPRLKAALESSHRLIHNWSRTLPGQTGGDSRNSLPEETLGRERFFNSLCKDVARFLQGLDTADAEALVSRLSIPFPYYNDYASYVFDLYQAIASSSDHDLEGWEQEGLVASGFRPDPARGDVLPFSTLEALPPEQAAAIRAILSANPAQVYSRRMSRQEVWNLGQRNLVRLPIAAFVEICGRDLAVERTVRNHAFTFEAADIERGRTFRFPALCRDPRGYEIILREGETFLTLLDPFQPDRLHVLDARFAYVGTCAEQVVASHVDAKRAVDAMRQAAHAELAAALPYRSRHADQEDAAAIAKAHNAAVLAELAAPAQPSAPIQKADAARILDAISAGSDEPDEDAGTPNRSSTLDDLFGRP